MDKKLTDMQVTRIKRFMDRITKRFLEETAPLQALFAWSKDPIPFDQKSTLSFKPIGEGETWGKAWESAWFRLRGRVPKAWAGKKVVARLDFSGEGLVFSEYGEMLQGIVTSSIFDPNFARDIVPLFDSCKGNEEVELWVEAAANSLFGIFTEPDPTLNSPNRYGHFDAKVTSIQIGILDEELWALWLDLRVLLGLITALTEQSVRRAKIIRTAGEAIDLYQDKPSNASRCRQHLSTELNKPAATSDLNVFAVGHAHIDTAWLWPVRETIRKCARTFSTQLALIDKYPDYIFGASQPQHYAFVKQHYPALYRKIKEVVAEGRWELQGGMWVEADCNLISGESLIRQILHGKNFFKDEFAVDVNNLWLPDVFGYSAAMPQIMRKSGIRNFLTQKLCWSQFNTFPHHTFRWRGIDGSEVLSHFPPENTYNGTLDSDSMIRTQENFHEKDFIDEFIVLFGVGDGGGGPKEENIELGLRQQNLEGVPRVHFSTAKELFNRLHRYWDRLPVWAGELYLEAHRGTLTTQAKVKKANRQLEQKLRVVELLWSALPLEAYPAQQLDRIWKKVLLNQFHDILPGSSIHATYQVTHSEHEELLKECDQLVAAAAGKLFVKDDDSLVLCNSLGYSWDAPVELPQNWASCRVLDEQKNPLPIQFENGRIFVLIKVAPYFFKTLHRGAPVPVEPISESRLVLENDLILYIFNAQGALVDAYDKVTGRQIIESSAPGNVMTLYDDHPNDWDAWDIDLAYENQAIETAKVVKVEFLPKGALRQGIRFEFTVGESKVEQIVSLTHNSRRLDFNTRVDWREKHKMLRVAFPVTIRSEEANFDIQYGYIKRSTHRNTLWDMARYEVAGHKYADLSDPDYGVSLLNDCKYGYKVHQNVLDLNLLRSPTYPDPDADQGSHTFTYSLLPHLGDLLHSEVMAQAAQLNQKLLTFDGYRQKGETLPWRLEGNGLSLEVVKKAEKEDCLILRIVETQGRHSSGKLILIDTNSSLIETNLMEWEDGAEIQCDAPVELCMQPFEIRTYKVKRNRK